MQGSEAFSGVQHEAQLFTSRFVYLLLIWSFVGRLFHLLTLNRRHVDDRERVFECVQHPPLGPLNTGT